uniref:Putative glutamate mutase subumit E n=1 Tax=uncultured bacterium esnapd4 TaxID=1366610 RepID=S5UBY3_9BACT|nr:putative glutamate mutase subumit E [uncultured bacterium esnapd4]QEO74993.1 omn18 [uncultured bacterium]
MTSFGGFVRAARARGRLVVQPRMGMSDPVTMRAGLLATRDAAATTVGTITVDSYTRVGDNTGAALALARGSAMNGYPITAHSPRTTRRVLHGLGFPVQVRHGSAVPDDIVSALIAAGMHATEGGPASYCLPYSRLPLRDSVENWARACERLAALPEHHLETFGGCMMGQLCPPSMLVAISVLEALFFRQHGLRSISLSYAQQTSPAQDTEAVAALASLAGELLSDVDWHVVIYAYMGVFPRTSTGARRVLTEAARLAVRTGSARLIVKTVAEAHRIPSVAENVAALEHADDVAAFAAPAPVDGRDTETYAEARAMIDAVLELDSDVGIALDKGFSAGYLDVPFCLHPDNAGRARSYLDADGRLRWSATGSLPIGGSARHRRDMTSSDLLAALSYMERRCDTN